MVTSPPYFRKTTSFGDDVPGGLNFVHRFFLVLNRKVPRTKKTTTQKRLMTSFKLNFGQKMPRFRKVVSGNLKIEKLPITLATSNFQETFVVKSDSK